MILPKATLASSLPSLVSSFLLKAQSSVTRGRISSTEVYTKEKRRTMSPCEYIKMSEHSFTHQEGGLNSQKSLALKYAAAMLPTIQHMAKMLALKEG